MVVITGYFANLTRGTKVQYLRLPVIASPVIKQKVKEAQTAVLP